MPRETVLVVEDERGLADVFTEWLESEYDVRTAYGGQEAIDLFDSDVDIALLDRRMPEISGDLVLEELRARGFEGPVAMVTAVQPDFDIVEMGFDDYIVKPVSRVELLDLLDELTSLPDYDTTFQRYYELAAKKAALETSRTDAELANSDEYAALLAELEDVRTQADQHIERTADGEEFSQLM